MAALAETGVGRKRLVGRLEQEGTGQPFMRQPGAPARRSRAEGGGAGVPPQRPAGLERAGGQPVGEMPGQVGDEPPGPGYDRPASGQGDHPRLPPGQNVQTTMPVLHYGRVPRCNLQTWDLRVYGATAV